MCVTTTVLLTTGVWSSYLCNLNKKKKIEGGSKVIVNAGGRGPVSADPGRAAERAGENAAIQPHGQRDRHARDHAFRQHVNVIY